MLFIKLRKNKQLKGTFKSNRRADHSRYSRLGGTRFFKLNIYLYLHRTPLPV